MARISDERNSQSSLISDGYAVHNDLSLQSLSFEMSSLPPSGFDDRTPTTHHADADPLLKNTDNAPAETDDSEYDLSHCRQTYPDALAQAKMWPARASSKSLSSKIRYNPTTPAGRQQIKRIILRSGARVPDHAHHLKTKSPSRYFGWRMGSLISCILSGLCLLITVTSLIAVKVSGSPYGGVGTIFTGSCDRVKRLDLWLHVVIKILGTILIGASNFNMQCLNAPNRKEIDAAHAKGYWLDIGVLSIRNYFYMSRRKALLWGLLAFSTIPLHLLLNSAIFSTLQTNDYLVIVVSSDFLQDELIDCTRLSRRSAKDQYRDVICSMYAAAHDKDNNETALTTLTPIDCIEKYANILQNRFSNVIAVSSNAPDNQTLLDAYTSYELPGSWNPMRWACGDYPEVTCDDLITNLNNPNSKSPPHWTIYNNYTIDHCLASTVTETCKLKMSLNIVAFVVISTTVKLVAMIVTLSTLEDDRFITIGDAIASFLENPDPMTKGGCLAMKIDLERSFFRARRYFLGDNACKNEPYEFLRLFCMRVESEWKFIPNAEVSLRWYQAPSNKRWSICMLTCFSALLLTGIMYRTGVNNMNLRQSIWSLGFGSLNVNAFIKNDPRNNLIGMVLLVNLPQLVMAILYFMYNSTFTCMLAAAEWSRYGQHRKGLRVTSPNHAQRSTYWLQLPWSYGLPLAIISSVLHWLVSQSIFLASFDVYDPTNQIVNSGNSDNDDNKRIPSNLIDCGYSPAAIFCLLIIGVIMVLVLALHGLRKLDPRMPIAGSCSLAISAACHRPPGDENAALLPVQWGAVSHETDDRPGHCCFTSFEVEPPIVGHEYA